MEPKGRLRSLTKTSYGFPGCNTRQKPSGRGRGRRVLQRSSVPVVYRNKLIEHEYTLFGNRQCEDVVLGFVGMTRRHFAPDACTVDFDIDLKINLTKSAWPRYRDDALATAR